MHRYKMELGWIWTQTLYISTTWITEVNALILVLALLEFTEL